MENFYAIIALIDKNNVVKELTVWSRSDLRALESATQQAIYFYGRGSYAIDVTMFPVIIGDTYKDEFTFIRHSIDESNDEIEIKKQLSVEERLKSLEVQIKELINN